MRDGTLWPGLLVAGLFAAEFVFLFAGVARTSASRSVVFLFSAPFFTAVGAHLLLPSERLNLVRVVGLIVAFGGVVAAAWDRPANGASWEGDLLVMGAAASLGLTQHSCHQPPLGRFEGHHGVGDQAGSTLSVS